MSRGSFDCPLLRCGVLRSLASSPPAYARDPTTKARAGHATGWRASTTRASIELLEPKDSDAKHALQQATTAMQRARIPAWYPGHHEVHIRHPETRRPALARHEPALTDRPTDMHPTGPNNVNAPVLRTRRASSCSQGVLSS